MKKFYQITSKSFEEMGVKSQKELWEKVKGEYKGFSCEVPVAFEKKTIKKADNTEDTVYTMVSSTSDKDRHGDIVVQNWILDGFNKNPVLLDSHNYDSITHILGKMENNRVEDNKLKHEIKFATMNPKGQLAKDMVDGGFINASSVGFIPLEFDNEGIILKSELLEVSLVSVPANAMALFEKTVKEIEADVETIKKEIEEEQPAEVIVVSKTEVERKRDILKNIAVALREMDKNNIADKKRKIFMALRTL